MSTTKTIVVKTPVRHAGTLADHALGSGVGAVAGALSTAAIVGAAQGAVAGTAAGLPGMVAGVLLGGAVGALVGNEMAQAVNPTTEEAYWQANHQNRSYFDSLQGYDNYAPAYRFGIESYQIFLGRDFDEIEEQLGHQWESARGPSRLTWETARLATRDAYDRLCDRA
jgi:hypothetical protein